MNAEPATYTAPAGVPANALVGPVRALATEGTRDGWMVVNALPPDPPLAGCTSLSAVAAPPSFDPLSLPTGAMVQAFRRSSNFQVHELSGTRVRATLSLHAEHHQPFGIVHGGFYALAVEGIASYGACAAVADRGMYAVGTSNTTDFLRPVTEAEVEVVAEPIFQGRTQQLWQVSINRLDDGKLVARGQLRLQNLPIPDRA
jgi:1,4-dihydroxy-2-naphthoyl-CoA hydrolase